MKLATISVTSVYARVLCRERIPRGIVGAKVVINYDDSAWDNLTKTVVFEGSGVTKDALNSGDVVEIPPEVVATENSRVRIGICGIDADENIVIPTLWADLGRTYPSADPSGDVSTKPGLPVWAQLQAQIDALKESGYGSIGDWNAPEGQPGHILNRTHWTAVSGAEILPETTLTTDEDGLMSVMHEIPFIVVGESYKVIWNGVEYTCTAQEYVDGDDGVILGNVGAFNEGTDTGEPFVMIQLLPEMIAEGAPYLIVIAIDGSTSATLSILGGETVHKLDNKYLKLDWLPVLKYRDIIPEYTGTFSSDSPTEIPDSARVLFDLDDGTNVVVYVNGKKYPATVCSNYDGKFIAEYGYAGGEPHITPPTIAGKYLFAAISRRFNVMFVAHEPGTYTVRVVDESKNRNRIPEEFLPDGYASGGNSLYVHVVKHMDGTVTADKTNAEIWDAFLNNRPIYCVYRDIDITGLVLHVVTGDERSCQFALNYQGHNLIVNIVDDIATVVYSTNIPDGTVELDTTLTQEGKAADAKAVGDAISKLSGGNVDLTGVVKLPTNEDGTPDNGTAGYYAVSDGNGGVTWVADEDSVAEDEIVDLNIELSSGYYWNFTNNSIGLPIAGKVLANAGSVYTPEPVDLGEGAIGGKLEIVVAKFSSASSRATGFCNGDGILVEYYPEKELFTYNESTSQYVAEKTITGRYLIMSLSSTSTIISIRVIKEGASSADSDTVVENSAYVSVDGSDEEGNGSADTPFATVSKALEEGFSDIVVRGGVYRERISINENDRKHDGKRVSIAPADPDGRVIFVDPDATIATTENLVSGYTKVYSATTSKTFADNNVWIFQDGVPDATTLISDDERHPLERGMQYRCEDTKIERCTATTLADALAEIESSDTYKWYIESGTIYFSRPQEITETNPLCGSFGKSLFGGFASRARTLELVGIESKYLRFNVGGMSRATLKDCKATNVYGAGAFIYDKSVSVEFMRCEAARCYLGGLGDGFNGHAANTGDPFSKQTTALFVDCWSHDNNDDGYSDHERSETTIIGGLYEYNGKSGVTPASGSHCTCYNVYSRKNYCGFFYTNATEAEEGGVGGQMMCINCVAENNNRGGTNTGYRVTSAENFVHLIGCKSIGHNVGYACSSGKMKLVDCGSLNDATVKSGNVEVQNTTIVT